MKKIIKITKINLVLLIAMAIIGITVSNATFAYNVSMNTDKTEFSKNDEFVVSVDVSDIQAEKGIITFGATIEYDKDSLTLVKMEGKNGWSNPSYNEDNGLLVTDRNTPTTTSGETVFQITFKVNENSKQNVTIKLNDVSVANGYELSKLSVAVTKNITVKDGTVNNTTNSNTDTNNNSDSKGTDSESKTSTGTTNTTNNENKTKTGNTTNSVTKTTNAVKTNTTDDSLPRTGASSIIVKVLLPSIIAIVAIIAVLNYVKIKKIEKCKK
jgi:hypothetical protein